MKEIKLTIPEGCKTVTVKVDGEQVITEFEPKDEKWTPEDGDFIAFGRNPNNLSIGIFLRFDKASSHEDYVVLRDRDICLNEGDWVTDNIRPATEEEKQRLFDALAKEGKRWNAEKKQIEGLPRWRAEKGNIYYYISENKLEVDYSSDSHGLRDDNYYNARNYFKTKEAAEHVAKQIREIFNKSKAE